MDKRRLSEAIIKGKAPQVCPHPPDNRYIMPETVRMVKEVQMQVRLARLYPPKPKPVTNHKMLTTLYCVLVLMVFCIIGFSIWLAVQMAQKQRLSNISTTGIQGDPFTMDDIFNSSYRYRSFSPRWLGDRDAYAYRKDDVLYSYDIPTETTEVLVPAEIFERVGSTSYYISDDLRYVMFSYDRKSQWRHSFYAKYVIYDRQADSSEEEMIEFPNDDTVRSTDLQFAQWSPTGHSLVFGKGNNLFYQSDPNSQSEQITTSGIDKLLFNGIPDWLYEEEILSSHTAVYWSPDSRYLLYAQFDCTQVPLFKFPYYGPKTNIYGDLIEIAYPKAGYTVPGTNTNVTLFAVDTTDLAKEHSVISPPSQLVDRDHYYIRATWRDSEHVLVVWANRKQDQEITIICGAEGEGCVVNHERTVVDGWIDPGPSIDMVEDASYYLRRLSKDEGESGSWLQVAFISAPTSGSGAVTFLTGGEHEVKLISAYEQDRKLVYYVTGNGDPKKRHLWRVGTPDADPQFQTPECISCDIAPDCQYVTTSFSSSGRYYVLGCRGPGLPIYYLKDTQDTLNNVVEDNADIRANLAAKDMPRVEYIQIPVGGGVTAEARLVIPPEVDRDPQGKFPLLVQVYAGAGSQAVSESWSTGFQTYMASSENVVYAYIDGRGTASRGDDFKHKLYRRVATDEIEDQLFAGAWLRDNLGYIDSSKMAVWGWSYGGFATYHIVANDSNVFNCGISGAALFDRRFYDTAHTERFMDFATPEDNLEGYDRTDVLLKIENLRGKHLLIVHGTADDNVHFASSAQVVKALTEAEIQFRFQMYTDLNHYFSSSSKHLYTLYRDFLRHDCWGE